MNKSILTIKDGDLFIGSWDLSRNFAIEHRALKKLVVKYKSEFEDVGSIAPAMQRINPKKRGGVVEEFLLNEPQATYLTTLLTNNETVRKFKAFLTKEFFRQRKLLYKLIYSAEVQRQNAEWIQKRSEGKLERKLETDTIKAFVQYAKHQGSQNAERYYANITKMENNALFMDYLEQKFPNLREVVNGFALDSLKMADRIVGKALKDGMEAQLPYKEIYLLAKERVETFATVLGKTPIQMILDCTEPRLSIATAL